MFKDVIIRKIDSHKGAPRLYLDMGLLGRANFGSGQQYQVSVDSESRRVTLEINEAGARVVSGKKKENNYVPVIDLNSIKVLGVFAGLDRVRIILSVGKIFILPLTSDMAQLERLSRVVAKLSSGECLTTASFCHGAGLMAHAAHEGLASGGVNTKAALVNEIDEEYIGQSMGHNPMWSEGTRALVVPWGSTLIGEMRKVIKHLGDQEFQVAQLELLLKNNGYLIAGKYPRARISSELATLVKTGEIVRTFEIGQIGDCDDCQNDSDDSDETLEQTVPAIQRG